MCVYVYVYLSLYIYTYIKRASERKMAQPSALPGASSPPSPSSSLLRVPKSLAVYLGVYRSMFNL